MPVRVQGPDGKTYQFPDGTDKDAAVRYFKSHNIGVSSQSPEPDYSRVTGLRNEIDKLSTVTPEDEAGHSFLANQAQKFGAGVIGSTAGVVNHPIKTVEDMAHSATPDKGLAGAGEMLLGPAGPMAVHTIENLIHNPAQTAGGIVGGSVLGDVGGEFASGIAKGVSEPLQSGGGGLIDRAAGSLKPDFAHGAQPGRAYLEGGGTPALTLRGLGEKAEAVKDTAGQKLGEAYDAASQPTPPAPIRGLLQAPQYDVPLAKSPDITGSVRQPSIIFQNRAMQRDYPPYGVNEPLPVRSNTSGANLGEEDFSDEEESHPSTPTFGNLGPSEYLMGRAGTRGGAGETQGVLRTRNPELAGQVMSPEPSGTPFPMGATRIPSSAVQDSLLSPVNRLRAIQNGPGGVGASPLLDEYESGIRGATGQDFTPRSLFDLKRNVAANTRWNDPTMFDMNSVRQQGVGGVGKLLTDAVPETAPLNRIYQGSGNLADRATLRADTGTPPFTSIVNRGLEGAAGVGLGYATHNPFLAAAPLLMDSVPVKTTAGYLLYNGGKLAGKVPSLGPIGAGTGALLPQETQ